MEKISKLEEEEEIKRQIKLIEAQDKSDFQIHDPEMAPQDKPFEVYDPDMDDELKKANSNMQASLQLAQTNSNHMALAGSTNDKNLYKSVEIKGLKEQNDGNNVNLDTQMAEMSKNKMLFDAIQSSIKKDSRLFRSVIESSSKN